MINLFENISSVLDDKEFAIGTFLDLSNAFDTVNHEIRFEKLLHYGIRGVTLDWVKSYFHEGKGLVQFNLFCSRQYKITCGAPQGSILGPFFFLLIINDLFRVSNILNSLRGGEVSPRKSVVQSACQYDVTSHVSNFQNGEQSVHWRDG